MKIIGYAGIVALSLMLCAVFSLILYIDVRRIKKTADRAHEKIDILCELIALDTEIRSANMHKNAYLLQIDNFLRDDPFGIDNKKIAVCRPNSGSKVDQKIYKMYKNAPATVKGYMETLSNLFGRIYRLNHPVKFKMLEFKKNMERRILLLLLKLCCFLIKCLDTCDKNKNKKKINTLKTHQKKYETYPKSMLLNGTPPEPAGAAA